MIGANICFGGKEKASNKDLKHCKFSPGVFIKILLGFFPRERVKYAFIWWFFSAYYLYFLLEETLNAFNCRVFNILFFFWRKNFFCGH